MPGRRHRGHDPLPGLPDRRADQQRRARLPPPFLRRCLQLDLRQPDKDKLARIVEAHLGEDARKQATELIEDFLNRRQRNLLATDQLLNAVYLLVSGAGLDPGEPQQLRDSLLRSLGEASPG